MERSLKNYTYLKDVVIVIPDTPQFGNTLIVLPEEHQVHHIQHGTVMALGKKCKADLKVGDKVIIDLYVGTRIVFDGITHIVYDSSDIRGKIL